MTAILLLNFGEPANPTLEEVVPFLERIFFANADLGGEREPDARRRKSRELAARRAPGLIAEYEAIGGSPLAAQAERQAEMLADELRRRRHEVVVLVGMQFTEPSIAAAVAAAREAGAEALVGLPVYPLAGPSTNVAALAEMRRAVDELGWDVPVYEICGWHNHPAYTALRSEGVRALCEREVLDLRDRRTRLVFSAHGTPLEYLRAGSRYDLYVTNHCRLVAQALGVAEYTLGFQNHTNRPIEWTQPDIDAAVRDVDADRVVVVPVSFMHEQSETLGELDHGLREVAEEAGLEFHRVPIPHDDPRFARFLGDIVEPIVTGANPDAPYGPCRCRAGAFCLNRTLEH